MKRLLWGFTLVASSALADDPARAILGTVPAESGGEIVFTVRQANCPADSKQVYSRNPNGQLLLGCWRFFDGNMLVRWEDGDNRLYDTDHIKFSQWFLDYVASHPRQRSSQGDVQ